MIVIEIFVFPVGNGKVKVHFTIPKQYFVGIGFWKMNNGKKNNNTLNIMDVILFNTVVVIFIMCWGWK